MTKILFLSFLISFYSIAQVDKPNPTVQESDTSASNFFSARSTPLNLALVPEKERQNCEGTLDMREEFRRRNLPDRRHQDTTGWCYAFVGADLMSYELSQNISPADIARQYLNSETPAHLASMDVVNSSPMARFNPLGGGFTTAAIEATRAGGFCLESEFPSEDYSWSEEQQLAMLAQYPDKQNRPSICLDTDNLIPLYTNIPIADLLGIVNADDFKRILNQLPRSSCNNRIPAPENLRINNIQRSNRTQFDHQKNEPFYQQIDEILTNNRPVSIGISTDIFQRPTESFRNISRAGHQVLLAGRRFNNDTGRCEYLIRNSDSGCRLYNSEYECENNHVWVPREIVRMGTFSADYVTSESGN